MCQELIFCAILVRIACRMPAFVIQSAHENRQLCAKGSCFFGRQAIAKHMQNRSQRMLGRMTISPMEALSDLVEPPIRGLQC